MNQSNEIWKPVVGYEGFYEVSNTGRVRTVARIAVRSNGRPHTVPSRIRKPSTDKKGYQRLTLLKDGKSRTHTVHSLVLTAFVEPRPEGMLTRHLNGIPDDNRVDNLAWGTGSENQYDAVAHGAHYLAAKKKCPRGHALSGPNLMFVGSTKRRSCRACNREHDSATHEGRPFDNFRADLRYQDVLAGRRRHKSEKRL